MVKLIKELFSLGGSTDVDVSLENIGNFQNRIKEHFIINDSKKEKTYKKKI